MCKYCETKWNENLGNICGEELGELAQIRITKFRGSFILLDENNSVTINFCPMCGRKLTKLTCRNCYYASTCKNSEHGDLCPRFTEKMSNKKQE